jgi:hypothetical protein
MLWVKIESWVNESGGNKQRVVEEKGSNAAIGWNARCSEQKRQAAPPQVGVVSRSMTMAVFVPSPSQSASASESPGPVPHA